MTLHVAACDLLSSTGEPLACAPHDGTFIVDPSNDPARYIRSIAVDPTDSNVVYAAYHALNGSPPNTDIFVVRSTDGGLTWGSPVRVNDDATNKHQLFPALAVSNGVLHVAWCDLRESSNPNDPVATNDSLNIYYAYSNLGGVAYPSFSANVRVSDVGQQANCTVVGFHQFGDYIGIAARYESGTGKHVVHVAWTDERDIPPNLCFSPPLLPPFNFDGNGSLNQNVYTDVITLTPNP